MFKNKSLVGMFLLIAIILIALYLYTQNLPNVGANIVKKEGSESFRNYGFNDVDSCLLRTNLDNRQAEQYTFGQVPYFRKFPFFNYYNSPQIIGCGGRRAPCDVRNAIPNILDPIDISNRNIAPNSVRVDQNLDLKLQKVGTVYKVFGNDNQIFPLYGRKVYYNDEKWEYFAGMGPTSEFLRVFQQRQWEELGNNDEVEIEGRCGKYRVSIYDRFMPQYTPFI
jgi:hypothetical protein